MKTGQYLCRLACYFPHVLFCLQSLLINFCRTFKRVYGSSYCTPNLHLHCHLHECINDFWPANAFWLFACERLNGILGSVSTNHRSIENQLMRKFTISQQAIESLSDTDGTEIVELLQPFYFRKGSLKDEDLFELPPLERLFCDNVSMFIIKSYQGKLSIK